MINLRTLGAIGLASFALIVGACERNSDSSTPASSDSGSVEQTPGGAPLAEPEPSAIEAGASFVQTTVDAEAGNDSAAGDEGAAVAEPGALVLSDDPCTSDADCVKQQCCHATSCGLAANAENCGPATACTMDCRGGTMDCGGGCLCQAGKCAAQLAPALGAG